MPSVLYLYGINATSPSRQPLGLSPSLTLLSPFSTSSPFFDLSLFEPCGDWSLYCFYQYPDKKEAHIKRSIIYRIWQFQIDRYTYKLNFVDFWLLQFQSFTTCIFNFTLKFQSLENTELEKGQANTINKSNAKFCTLSMYSVLWRMNIYIMSWSGYHNIRTSQKHSSIVFLVLCSELIVLYTNVT